MTWVPLQHQKRTDYDITKASIEAVGGRLQDFAAQYVKGIRVLPDQSQEQFWENIRENKVVEEPCIFITEQETERETTNYNIAVLRQGIRVGVSADGTSNIWLSLTPMTEFLLVRIVARDFDTLKLLNRKWLETSRQWSLFLDVGETHIQIKADLSTKTNLPSNNPSDIGNLFRWEAGIILHTYSGDQYTTRRPDKLTITGKTANLTTKSTTTLFSREITDSSDSSGDTDE